MNPLKGVPPIYYLSLAGENERQKCIQDQFDKYFIKDTKMILGFDGRKTDLKNNPLVRGSYFDALSSGDVACSMGHIQMIKTWLETSDSDTALFLEDDVNLDNCEYWSFLWSEMVEALPKGWKCMQLALIKPHDIEEVKFRPRITNNWSVTAYLLKRDYAKFLLDHYYVNNQFVLNVFGDPRALPIVENLIYFPAEPHVYTFPIFTEKNTFSSTFIAGQKKVKEYNDISEKSATKWWQNYGKKTSLSQFMDTTHVFEPIPMLGTAVVNNTKWVKRLIESVDHPVKEFLIINNNGRGIIDKELDEIAAVPHKFIGKIRVLHMACNLGVPASWNLMIKSYIKAPYWIIMNDDVAFTPGLLAEMHLATLREPMVGMIHAHEGDHGIGSWDLFLIRDHVVINYGLFDENLYPAYNEDADYFMRFLVKPIRRIMSLQGNYLHGDGNKQDYHTHGRQTAKSDSKLHDQLHQVNLTNFEYMTQKWTEGWRLCAPSQTPFRDKTTEFPISYTTFDLKFIRSKHLGF